MHEKSSWKLPSICAIVIEYFTIPMINVHPMLVHFPIAFLTLYAVCELIPWRTLRANPAFRSFKTALVIVGAISALAARQAGEMIEDMFESGPDANLVEMHSLFGNATTIIFCVIAGAYIVELLHAKQIQKKWVTQVLYWLHFISRIVLHPIVVVVLALLGLIAVSVAGALGGAIVYGPDVDPFVSFIYHALL